MQFNKNSKVLITGANGFIGSRLVQRLLDLDVQVFSLVRNRESANPHSEIITVDLANSNLGLPEEQFDVVYHLASLTPYEKNKNTLKQVNYQGTKNLFDEIKNKTKSVVYISGLTVFDSKYEDIDENTVLNPDTYFTKLRVMAQRYLEEQCRENKIEYTTAHVGDIVYGEGGFFMNDLVDRLKKNRFMIPGNGKYFKNYVHVDDVVGALLAIIQHDKTNQSFIITGSNHASFKEFVNFTCSEIGINHPKNIPEFLAKMAIGKDLVNLLTKSMKASNQKIRTIYDFKYPKYQDGIKKTFNKKNYK